MTGARRLRYVKNVGKRCSNCRVAPAYSKGRCEPCYRWWRRTGEERPIEMLVRYGRRLEA